MSSYCKTDAKVELTSNDGDSVYVQVQRGLSSPAQHRPFNASRQQRNQFSPLFVNLSRLPTTTQQMQLCGLQQQQPQRRRHHITIVTAAAARIRSVEAMAERVYNMGFSFEAWSVMKRRPRVTRNRRAAIAIIQNQLRPPRRSYRPISDNNSNNSEFIQRVLL